VHIAFFNPQGNFNQGDAYLTEHPDFGGQLVYVKEVAMAMVEAGHRVDILTRRIVDPDWPEFSGAIDHYDDAGDDLRIVRIACGGDPFLAKEQLWPHMPEFIDGVLDFYGNDLPQFTTAHYADGGYCAALMQARTGIPFTFTGHSLGAQKMDKLGMNLSNRPAMEQQFRFSRRISAERIAMNRAWRVITSTDMERREQYAHPLYAGAIDVNDDDRFAVIPPGVNMRVFHRDAGPAESALAEKLGSRLFDAQRPHLLVSSRIDEKKNIMGTVAAYTASPELQGEAGLVICVRGIDDPFEDIVEDAGLRGKVDFLNIGSQQELAATYRFFAARQSVFVLTAIYEPFGLAPIEAAACGLACVATRNGGPSEIFADGSGILVDPFDHADIAAGMQQAIANYPDLSDRSARRVREKYTWEQTAAGYLSVIESGLGSAPRSIEPIPEPDAGDRIVQYLDQAG
jgi:sucrose-phosphate synthase